MAVNEIFWDNLVTLENGVCCAVSAGAVSFWVRRVDEEIQTALQRNKSPEKPVVEMRMPSGCPEEVSWERFYAPSYSFIRMLPALPNLPVILKSSEGMKFLPGEEARYYVRMPLWIQVVAEVKQRKEIIMDVPETILSRTWSGAPSSGFISYFLTSELRRGEPASEPNPVSIFCPLVIRNESKRLLSLNRMCVHTENLNVYTWLENFVTNSLSVTIRGDALEERIQIADRPPRSFKGTKLINKARIRTSDNILSKSFTLIRQVATSD